MDEETRLVPVQFTNALTDANALSPVEVAEVATKIVAAFDLIASLVPDLRTPHSSTARKVRGARTVSREVVVSILAMVEAASRVLPPDLVNVERAHEVLEHDHNFRVLDERIERFRDQVRYTIEARWAEVVQECMAAYSIVKGHAKDPRYADLAAHIEIISGHLGRTNATTSKKTKKAKAKTPSS
jgi:hypothetical protein